MRHGRCLCGSVTFEYDGEAIWRAHCHCESCRRNTASPFTTWFGVPKSACRFTGDPPRIYVSSPGARRMFCARCGTPMAFEHDNFPGEIHLYAASLDDHATFAPQFHVHWSERVRWVELSDDLPRHEHGAE